MAPTSTYLERIMPNSDTSNSKPSDPGQKVKSSYDVAFWNGLGDELKKIATATGVLEKIAEKKSSTLTSKPKMTATPAIREPDPPASVVDHIGSSRTIQPPPITAGTY